MKESKIKKAYLKFIFAVVIIIIVAISFLVVKTKIFTKREYIDADIIVEVFSNKHSKKYIINLETYDGMMKATTNFFQEPIYVLDNEMIYLKNGRYKRISGVSYGEIFNNLNEVSSSGEHPQIEREWINRLLTNLLIDYQTDRGSKANVTAEEGSLKKFSLYLSISDDKKLGISVELKKSDEKELKKPLIVDTLIDEVDGSDLKITLEL